MKYFLLNILIAFSITAYSQDSATVKPKNERETDLSTEERGSRVLTAGYIVTGIGGGLAVSGAGIFGAGYYTLSHGNPDNLGPGILCLVSGIGLMVISAPFLIAGPICIARGRELKRAANRTSLWLAPIPGGLALKF